MNGPIRSMVDLTAAARAAQIERGLSDQVLEALAGVASGSVSKYLGPNPSKKLGPISTFPLLGALGKCLAVVDDPEQIAKVEKRWTKRHVRGGAALQMRALEVASASMLKPQESQQKSEQMTKSEKLKMWGQMGGKASAKRRMKTMKKRERQRIASHAARRRWAKRDGQAHQG